MRTRSIRSARARVALLIETSLGPGRDILRGVAQYVRERGGWSLHYEPRGLEERAPEWLARWRGEGVIARLQNPALVAGVARLGIPVVDVLGVVNQAGFPLVHVDDAAIARLAAAHLHERGLRQFGYFGIAGENWSERRREAFAAAVGLARGDLRVYESPRHLTVGKAWDQEADRLARWVEGLPKPVGVMICSDQRGSQFLEACRRAGAQVPDEVAVIGVDDDEPLCEVCHPPLSSVRPAHSRVGYVAAELLDRLMAGRQPPAKPILVEPVGVTTRLSTDVLAVTDASLASAVRLIREQACAGLRVEMVARHAGLSRSVLQRRFREALGRTVHEEILQTRLKRACELLTETELGLVDVAERAGFRHQEYMGAVFKAHLGRTPAQHRRLFRV